MEKEEEEEEDGRGYLVSRIIKAGDPLGFVYVVEGPGEREGVWRKERRKERRKRGGERGRGRGNGGREENREIKVGEEGEREREKREKK